MAAEIMLERVRSANRSSASMRPRRMAAEIAGLRSLPPRPDLRFNEAAANGRGNRGSGRPSALAGLASMRPRRMAAEISPGEPHILPRELLQ